MYCNRRLTMDSNLSYRRALRTPWVGSTRGLCAEVRTDWLWLGTTSLSRPER